MLYNAGQHSLIYTHAYTGGRGYHARCHLLFRGDNHSHNNGAAIQSNCGFSISPKDTLTFRQVEPEIKPPTFQEVDNLLDYLLRETKKKEKIV